MKKALLILAAALGLSACASQVPGQVKVTGGTIQGEVLEDMTVYKGIPFAAPPVVITKSQVFTASCTASASAS